FQQHLPLDPSQDGRKISLDYELGIGLKENLADWRKKRANKTLHQLQLEVCEAALVELSKVKRLSKEQKDSTQKKIEAEIEKLRRTKQPVFLKAFFFHELTYKEDVAKRVREAVKSGSSEDIGIIR